MDEKLEELRLVQYQNMITDIMVLLKRNGIVEVNTGAILRIIGLSNDEAAEYDDYYMSLNDVGSCVGANCEAGTTAIDPPPPGTTFH